MNSKGITRERTGKLLRELFQVLMEQPEGMQAREALEAVAGRIKLTEHEKGEYDTGGRRFEKILRFATVDAVKAGWLLKNKGVWSVTPEGSAALQAYQVPGDFYREAVRLYRKWKQGQEEDNEEPKSADQILEAKITLEEAEEQAWAEISSYLETIDPYCLQDLVSALLEAMGYHVSWTSPPGKDGGVDILAWNDPLGTRPPRIKVQVKRRKDNIAVEELRSFLALINVDDVGIFVTTGGFTRDAADLARSQEQRKITLLDRQNLVDLWVEYNDKIDKDKRVFLPLKPVYFLNPSD